MKVSLRIKTICAVLISALLLAGAAVAISYAVYAGAFTRQYQTMTMNLAKTTAVTVDAEELKTLRDAVFGIYQAICRENDGIPDFANYSEADMEAYYSRYSGILEMREYKNVLVKLQEVLAANHAASIYIGYIDTETLSGIYLADGASEESACYPGTRDAIEEVNVKRLKQGDYDFPAYVTNYPEYGWLCSAGAGILDSEGQYVATMLVDISMSDVMEKLRGFVGILCLALASITAVLLLLVIFFMDRIIVSPVKKLSLAAASFVSDKKKHGEGDAASAISKLRIRTRDEVGDLCKAIQKMEQEINDYIENLTSVTAEKERMGAELSVATNIQASMLPCIFPAFPEREEFDIYATMDPAKEVGGDFYDFFLVDKDHLALVMADVSGKGVPAALFMVIAKTLLKNSALGGCSPKKILETVNNQLCENNEAEMFVTVWIGILTISTGELVCANAGHEYPVVRKAGGAFELFRDKHGLVLAGMEGAKYQEYELHMDPGDALFIYTDGVPEAMDENEGLFGTVRMIKALNAGKNGCKELLEVVRKEIDAFVGEAPQFDDITMLCLEYRGNAKKEGIA